MNPTDKAGGSLPSSSSDPLDQLLYVNHGVDMAEESSPAVAASANNLSNPILAAAPTNDTNEANLARAREGFEQALTTLNATHKKAEGHTDSDTRLNKQAKQIKSSATPTPAEKQNPNTPPNNQAQNPPPKPNMRASDEGLVGVARLNQQPQYEMNAEAIQALANKRAKRKAEVLAVVEQRRTQPKPNDGNNTTTLSHTSANPIQGNTTHRSTDTSSPADPHREQTRATTQEQLLDKLVGLEGENEALLKAAGLEQLQEKSQDDLEKQFIESKKHNLPTTPTEYQNQLNAAYAQGFNDNAVRSQAALYQQQPSQLNRTPSHPNQPQAKPTDNKKPAPG